MLGIHLLYHLVFDRSLIHPLYHVNILHLHFLELGLDIGDLVFLYFHIRYYLPW